jgi:hypothetical protein
MNSPKELFSASALLIRVVMEAATSFTVRRNIAEVALPLGSFAYINASSSL